MTKPSLKFDILLPGSWRGATSVLLSIRNHHIVIDTGLPHEDHQLVQALKNRGLDPTDIGTVINTHLHVDHVMNNHLFPNSLIYASQQSYEWCSSMYSEISGNGKSNDIILKYYPEISTHQLSHSKVDWIRKFALRWWDLNRLGERSRFRWLERSELPADLECCITSGHVPGHASIVVRNGDRPAVIAGDALLSLDHDDKILTMIPFNQQQYQLDREKILAYGGVIVPGHDHPFTAPSTRTTPAAG